MYKMHTKLLMLALLSVAVKCDDIRNLTARCSFLKNESIGSHWYLIDNFVKNYSNRLPPNSDVVLGDYFPTVRPWYNCIFRYWGDRNALLLENLKALYWDLVQNIVGVPNKFLLVVVHGAPYSVTVYHNQYMNSDVGGRICLCKGAINITAVQQTTCWGHECKLNHTFHNCNVTGMCGNLLYGLQWSNSELMAYLSGDVYRIKIDNLWFNNATIGKTIASNRTGPSLLMNSWWFNPVYNLTYYRVNKTADTVIVQNCTNNCADYVNNIFSTQPGGIIPEGFSFNNWFVLTNDSTITDGRFLTRQPLLVNCLWPVPSFSETSQTFCFDTVDFVQCNGYKLNSTADVIRFNLNFTHETVVASGTTFFMLNTTGGVVLYVSCYNQSRTEALVSDSFVPFGKHDGSLYCYVSYNDTLQKFIGVLPPSVKEIAISKDGGFYINGYNYFQTFPIDCISFNLTTGNTGAFWTIAYTSYTDVMVDVENTAIKSVIYCNSHINDIRCNQLTPSLPDGFYPVSPKAIGLVNKTFVTLPANFDHVYVNITGNVRLKVVRGVPYNNGGNATLSFQGCIAASQFTVNLNHTCTVTDGGSSVCTGSYGANVYVTSGSCPFAFDRLNNHMSFDKLCFSTVPLGDDCRLDLTVQTRYFTGVFAHVYVSYKFGLDIVGLPKSDAGLKDLSVLHLNVCTEYNIYGFAGTGIIRVTNQTVLGGLYYTSLSGDLLGFKNVTTGTVYSITPCEVSAQAAVIDGSIVGAITSVNSELLGLKNHIVTPYFYYYSVYNYTADNNARSMQKYDVNCTPVISYSNMGVCANGALVFINVTHTNGDVQPISTGNVTIPSNFTISVQMEYVQVSTELVSIDCARYVCNGNARCGKLLSHYVSACHTIEQALAMGSRLESMELESMISISENALALASVEEFNSSQMLNPIYNESGNTIGGIYLDGLKDILPRKNKHGSSRSTIEDLLFNKVVTTGLGTVDEDYKRCTKGADIADLACAQYYNGIMVLPGVANDGKMSMYTASLSGGISLGALGGGAVAIPFSLAVQARLNYVALQTDVLQRNQEILAASFNQAIGNITIALGKVNNAIYQTSQSLSTVAQALTKVQDVVNSQGKSLNQLTLQLQNNFQAISSSIQDIYYKLDEVNADAQVDRLITGRLAALNAFVTQTLTRQAEVRASRQLAKEKVNECVRSQSSRFGFCGNGTHLFSLANAAPNGMVFFHTVLVPTAYQTVTAWSGICASDGDRTFGLIVKDVSLTLFRNYNNSFYLTPRTMYQPRVATSADFVQIAACDVLFVNATILELPSIIPDYIDINKTVQDLLDNYKPNWTVPDFSLDIFNQTYLNITNEINDLENRSVVLYNTTKELELLIQSINNTLVDLEWLNRIETYVKWPWYVWVAIALIFLLVLPMLLFCCLSTGCCGCCGCLSSCAAGCCKYSCSRDLSRYEPIEKVHVN